MNQSFFRSRILSAYDYRCCVTGLTVRPLLVASHIIPWSEDAANRLNPRNGLCLNALHDRAFDRGLMWIEPDFTIRFSPYLNESPSGSEAILNGCRDMKASGYTSRTDFRLTNLCFLFMRKSRKH